MMAPWITSMPSQWMPSIIVKPRDGRDQDREVVDAGEGHGSSPWSLQLSSARIEMLREEGDLVGDHELDHRRVIDREMVGIVVAGDAAPRLLGHPDGDGGIHQVLAVADADQQR